MPDVSIRKQLPLKLRKSGCENDIDEMPADGDAGLHSKS